MFIVSVFIHSANARSWCFEHSTPSLPVATSDVSVWYMVWTYVSLQYLELELVVFVSSWFNFVLIWGFLLRL